MNIRDIAKLSGVAVSTVSRVLNGHPDVSQETRDHVLQIMQQNRYVPNNSARNLKLIHSNTIGVMVKGRDNPFFSLIIATIEAKLSSAHFSMLLHYHHSNEDDASVALGLIKEKRLRGLICLGGDFTGESLLVLSDSDVPIVLTSVELDGIVVPNNISTVSIRNSEAAYQATKALLELGHRCIGLVSTGKEDRTAGRLRSKGYSRAILEYGLEPRLEYGIGADYTFESAYRAGQKVLSLKPRPTAIFATSDIMAIGVAKAALEMGLKIPQDLSVMGFDGLDYGDYFHPTLATVKQPVEQMGICSAELLLGSIEHNRETKHMTLDTELWMRASVGPCLNIEEEHREN